MKLSHEQEAFVEAIRDFSSREGFGSPEHDGHSPEVAARLGELGWYGLQIPEQYGGSGGSFVDATLFLEEVARGRIPVSAYGVTLIVVGALNRFGTEEQKRDLFGRVVAGGTLAIAMSEPEAGSDVANLKTKARRENGGYVLDGAYESTQRRSRRRLIVDARDVGLDEPLAVVLQQHQVALALVIELRAHLRWTAHVRERVADLAHLLRVLFHQLLPGFEAHAAAVVLGHQRVRGRQVALVQCARERSDGRLGRSRDLGVSGAAMRDVHYKHAGESPSKSLHSFTLHGRLLTSSLY